MIEVLILIKKSFILHLFRNRYLINSINHISNFKSNFFFKFPHTMKLRNLVEYKNKE